MTLKEFQQSIVEGIPETLPQPKPYDTTINHAPKRKDILTAEQKELAKLALTLALQSYAYQLACTRILDILQPCSEDDDKKKKAKK